MYQSSNYLTTRPVDPTVRLKDSSATTLSALLATLIYEASSGTGRSADLDLVLLTCGRTVGVKTAAFAGREKQIVVVAILGNKGGLDSMFPRRLKSDIGCSGSDLEGRVVHVDREQIVPKGSEGHDELGSIPIESAIDSIVVFTS